MLDHSYNFICLPRRCHAAQTTAQRLLGQDACFAAERPQRHNGCDVLHVPAFPKHQDAHDAVILAAVSIQFATEFSQRFQVFIADVLFVRLKGAGLLVDLALEIRVQVDRTPIQFLEDRITIEPRGDLIRGLRVLTHHKQQRLLPALEPFVAALEPAFVAQLEMHLIFPCGVVGGLFHQLSGATDDRRLHDARIHRFTERRVTDDMLEVVRLVVLGRRGEIELCHEAAIGAFADGVVEIFDRLVPCGIRIPDVMGFIVEHHHALMTGDALAQRGAGVERLGLADTRPHPVVHLAALALPGVVEQPVNVRQVKRAAGAGAAGLVLQDGRQIPIAAPFDRDQRVVVEDVRAAAFGFEVFLQSLKDRQVRCHDHEMPRHQ